MEFETVNGAWRAKDGTFWMLPSRNFYADGRTKPPTERRDALVLQIHRGLLRITSGGPTLALMAVAAMRRQLDDLEHEVIANARGYYWSWRNIASVLGKSPAAIHQRFAKKRVERRKRR